jgi:hypothetical protein
MSVGSSSSSGAGSGLTFSAASTTTSTASLAQTQFGGPAAASTAALGRGSSVVGGRAQVDGVRAVVNTGVIAAAVCLGGALVL